MNRLIGGVVESEIAVSFGNMSDLDAELWCCVLLMTSDEALRSYSYEDYCCEWRSRFGTESVGWIRETGGRDFEKVYRVGFLEEPTFLVMRWMLSLKPDAEASEGLEAHLLLL